MSSLSTTHKEYILELLMLDYLYQGIIPTADQLSEDLAAYMEEHPNLNEPTSKAKDWTVAPGENSSASQIHEIADCISQDVGVVTREIYRIAQDSSRFYDRWTNEMKRLSAYARKLEQRTDSLLLLNTDTMGFFAYVGDVFSDMNNIDTEETTAKVDLHDTSVTINPAFTELSSAGSLINLSHITESDISFQVLTKKPGTAYMTTGDGNMLSNIFKASNSTWVGKVLSSGGAMVCELKVKLGDKDYEVSRIAVEFTGPLGTSESTVTCMYSADGYTWYLVPSVNPTKTVVANVAWIFPLTTMRYIKFIFHKPAPDSADNSYIFSISYVRLFGQEYETSAGGTFVSVPMQAINASGVPILFSLVALNVCQEILPNTGIDYSIAASRDGETWTDWMMISPSDSEGVLYPKIINLSGADWKDNTDISTTVLLDDTGGTTDPAQEKITKTFSNLTHFSTHLIGYRFKGSNYGVVNTAIPISTGEDPDPISNSVVVWRNVRYKNTLDYPDTLTVRSVPRGWGFNGGEYSCYFEVISSDGKVIDFGDSKCAIDGAEATGIVTIPPGIHKFVTKAENWHDVASGYSALGAVTSQEELQSIDPLYPYNHKLLIDGFPYPTGASYQGERVYTGTDISAEFCAVRASLFDIENNLLSDDQYGYFAVRSVGDEEYPTLAVVVRFDTGNSDYTNELFTVRWRSGATDASMYTYIKLRAQLWTSDAGLTPVLTSYRIKLGV